MTCPEKSNLMMWTDGELHSSDADKIADHIEQCTECRNFVSAQKQMESVWRDGWTDPSDASFEIMRGKLKPEIPWWRTQKTWYIAAVLCAAYIGVRLFYVDASGTSLSSIAAEEMSSSVQAAPDAPLVEEVVEDRDLEMEEQENVLEMDETGLASGQSGISVHEEELSVESRVFSVVSESADAEEDALLIGDFAVGYSEMESTTEIALDQPMDIAQASDQLACPEEQEDMAETGAVYRSVNSSSTVTPGYGMIEGTMPMGGLSGGGGGGTAAASDSGDMSCDDSIADAQSTCSSQEEQACDEYSIAITLETKIVLQIQRYQWNSLFSLIDTLLTENCYPAGEQLVLYVSDEGIISGPEVPAGTVIDLPETCYGDCTVTVTSY